jgi:hypothetical protein
MSFEKDAVVLEKNARLARIAGLATVVTIAIAIGQLSVFGGTMHFLLLAALPFTMWSRVQKENWRARPRRARVHASAEGVWVDGAFVLPPKRIAHGIVQPRPGKKPTVRLRNEKQNVVFDMEVEDEAEGIAFLRAIHHDAGAKKATFRALSPFFATRLRTLLSLFACAALGALAVVATFAALDFGAPQSFIAAAFAFAPLLIVIRGRSVEVGADGLSLSWNTHRSYIRFEDVASVEVSELDSIVVTLHDGQKIPLRTGGSSGWDGGEGAALLREALLRRIHEAMDAHRGRIGPREIAAQLAPGARDHRTWLSDLKKLRDGEGGYRNAALREDDLWRVVEDPGAPEEARAAAAVLLRPTEGAKPRLRVAADAVASPRLRVALESEEEDVAEEALKVYVSR